MKPFLIAYVLCVLIVSSYLYTYDQGVVFLYLNHKFSDLGDLLFPFITYLGGGLLSAIVVLIFLLKQYRLAIIATSSFVLTGIVVQLLKHTLFAESRRPIAFFVDSDVVHTVAGVHTHSYNSFPSGHSATVFSLFFMLALILKGRQRIWGIALFLIALLGGYSRIYLGQHFPVDVLVGSVLGVGITFLCYKILNKRLLKMQWSDRGLLKSRKA